ncbi:MAG: RNA polymerase sigma factor [Myxococcota bacterium]
MSTRWMMTARLPPEELVLDALSGGQHEVNALARAWLPHVYRWCARLGGPGFDSEDAAHEVLITMCRRLGGLRDAGQFPAWLFGITRRTLANHRRRAWWRRWLPAAVIEERPAPGGPQRHVEISDAHRIVWTALSALSEAHREVLVLCELEERSGSEAAVLLGIPLGTVKSRLRAARTRFRAELGEEEDVPSDSVVGGGR